MSATALLAHYKLSALSMPFLNVALSNIATASAGPCGRDDDTDLAAAVWSEVFNVALDSEQYDTCFTAVLRNTKASWGLDCLRRLIVAMCRARRVRQLMSFPFDHTQVPVVEERLTWLANTSRLDVSADASVQEGRAEGAHNASDGEAASYYRILYVCTHRAHVPSRAVAGHVLTLPVSVPCLAPSPGTRSTCKR